MKRIITITINHMAAASDGAAHNIMAKAINDHLKADYHATVNAFHIMIWPKGFAENSLHTIPIPDRFFESTRLVPDDPHFGFDPDDLPLTFEIDLPEEYHRRPGRNPEEDIEFISRHGE